MRRYVLAIDQGTTGTTVVLVDERGRFVRRAERELSQRFPRPGWVEHDPGEIWTSTLALMKRVARGIPARQIASIGIANQRETTILWDRKSGRPLHPAIVWQDRRTAPLCDRLRRDGLGAVVKRKTGLLLDAYFSATKIAWLLGNVPRARGAAFGTVDSWLLWNLTGGRVHATDPTNASRTLLFDIHRREWDPALLEMFGIPASMLPEVKPASAGSFGTTRVLGGEIPILGIAGDQQAALFGQCCWEAGTLKNTYGTGCFTMLNTGRRPVGSKRGLLTTLACDSAGRPCYALEGSVFIAGAAVQWLRDALGIIPRTADVESLARSTPTSKGVVFVPAFAGLGAPYWDMGARGAILGLTRGTGRAEIARAALEAIAFQSRDVIDAMAADTGRRPARLRVDGGATANDLLMQIQADVLGIPIERPANIESTSLGAAFLAGRAAGLWDTAAVRRFVRVGQRFRPHSKDRDTGYAAWKAAVARVGSRSDSRR